VVGLLEDLLERYGREREIEKERGRREDIRGRWEGGVHEKVTDWYNHEPV
jgi:hypothetical protein